MTREPPATIQVGRRVPVGVSLRGEFTYSVVETQAAGDRRSEPRSRTRLREGQLGERLNRPLVDCRIRDLTRRGARLQLEKDRPLPRAFYLTEGGSRRSYRATLVWQVGRDAGVRLTAVE